ncbi:hypothetical protein [Candidatus Poriferisodalis sp.]|uniref:hypothetical protein n=1 Tax=Candidatus Poriferisodalis sp. TaxID=3101277 RepID=UPI003B026298
MAETVHMLLPIDTDDSEALEFVARQAQRCADRSRAVGDMGAGPDELREIFEERGWAVDSR